MPYSTEFIEIFTWKEIFGNKSHRVKLASTGFYLYINVTACDSDLNCVGSVKEVFQGDKTMKHVVAVSTHLIKKCMSESDKLCSSESRPLT